MVVSAIGVALHNLIGYHVAVFMVSATVFFLAYLRYFRAHLLKRIGTALTGQRILRTSGSNTGLLNALQQSFYIREKTLMRLK